MKNQQDTRTFCRKLDTLAKDILTKDVLSNGQYDERTFRRKDTLSKGQLSENGKMCGSVLMVNINLVRHCM